MTQTIDAITHQLNSAHIARQLHEIFETGESSVQVVCEAFRINNLASTIRVNLSQHFTKLGIAKHLRYGLRCSEPFPFSFEDGRPGRFYCIHIDIYHSQRKTMLKALDDVMEGISL